MEDEQLSPLELAARERVALSTVYGWNVAKVGPPYVRRGRTIRYRLAEVIEWEKRFYATTGDAA